MLIDYDHRRNIHEEERLASLKRSVQQALDEIYEAIGTSEGGQIVINKTMPKADILEFAYPVGSVYYTVLKAFNPNENEFPGVWVLMNPPNPPKEPTEGEEPVVSVEPEVYQWKRTE